MDVINIIAKMNASSSSIG